MQVIKIIDQLESESSDTIEKIDFYLVLDLVFHLTPVILEIWT